MYELKTRKVIEECSEAIKAICKAEEHGWFNYHPAKPELSNVQGVLHELEDVIQACIHLRFQLHKIFGER